MSGLARRRVNPAGLAVTAAASVRLMMTIRPRRELVRVLLGSVIAGAMGLLVLILSDGQADALWACAILIGAAACFLGVSRRGMLLCSLMGLLVAQGAAGVSGVLRADVQPWTDAALLCAKRIHRAGGNCAPNRHFPADPAGHERGTPRMRKLLTLLLLLLLLLTSSAMAAEKSAYRLADEQGTLLAWLDVPPAVGDVLLTADGTRHRVIAVEGQQAVLREDGTETLPDVPWSARETAQPVTSAVRTIGLMGDAALVRDLREGLANQGAALVTVNPEQADFPLTVARDEISNAAEYDTLLSGEKAAKIRLIVRRGGDNEALMKNFALSVKAGLDHTAPTLIRDVYFAANAQEPLRMLWGARETEPIRLQNTILPLAQVISNALAPRDTAGGISGSEDVPEHSAVTGLIFAGGLLLAGVVGYGLLLTGGRRHGKKI